MRYTKGPFGYTWVTLSPFLQSKYKANDQKKKK